ncbi:hypothetical protein MMC26_006467 [Xylographa opegraphella]|nr:hypothetical protein [Xylographa opegraphella]
MSEAPVHEMPAVDPAAIEPTSTASEATSDPIRPTGTNTLAPESRSEIVSTDASEAKADAVTALPGTELAAEPTAPVENQPITDGILGYKAPGLLKGLRFSKKFFWFGNDALDEKSLALYLKTEKPEIGHHNSAHASQTGKGLLLFAKRVEDKTSPAGILNLGDASDLSKEELTDFSFKLQGHKHTFQAGSKAERDSWFSAVETTAAEAKTSRPAMVESEGYKNQMNKLNTPAAALVPAAAAARSTSTAKKSMDVKVHDGTQDNHIAAAEATPRMNDKSRSQSRKRQSLFGKVLGKKDESEEKKEIKKEEKAEKGEERKEIKPEEIPEKAELIEETREAKHGDVIAGTSTFDAAAVAARVIGEPVVPIDGTKGEESAAPMISQPVAAEQTSAIAPEVAAKPTKRGSVFGSLFGKKDGVSPSLERRDKDIVPAVPAKDSETLPVATAGPHLDPTVLSAPSVGGATTETETAATSPAAKAISPGESKGGMFGFLKQKETQKEERREEKKEMKAEVGTEAKEDTPVVAAETSTIPGSGISPPSTTDVMTPATSEPVLKEKRRQSFFGSLGGKKDRKVDSSSDNEATGGKLGGMFRRASRSTKASQSATTDSSAPPAPIAKDLTATTEAVPEATEAQNHVAGESALAGDAHESNMPEPVTRSRPAVVEATA